MVFVGGFLLAFVLSVVLTFFVRQIALRFGVVDHPNLPRKKHETAIPLLGGVAVFLSFFATVFLFEIFGFDLFSGYLLEKHVVGLLVGGLVLMIGGVLDDKYDLRPSLQFLFPVIASVVVIASGVGISYISNPVGDSFSLENFIFTVFTYNDLPYQIVFFADLFSFVWLMGMMYTTKVLDGLDGLTGGVTVLGAIVLYFLSMKDFIAQPETAFLSIVVAGAFAGFLIFNFHPAKIFLGESGSVFAGFIIGALAIISGGKLATALLIMSIPIVDLLFVLFERLFSRGGSVATGDSRHLHYRLRDLGLSVRQVVLLFYVIVAVMGGIALMVDGKVKLFTLISFSIILLVLLFLLSRRVLKR